MLVEREVVHIRDFTLALIGRVLSQEPGALHPVNERTQRRPNRFDVNEASLTTNVLHVRKDGKM